MHHHHDDSKLNSDSCIWGVEINEDYSATDVRDAMVTCFVNANGDMIAKMSGEQMPEDEHERLHKIEDLTIGFVQKAFAETGGDYERPTKETIMAALEGLKAFAKQMNHDDSMISKHAFDITRLADGLK